MDRAYAFVEEQMVRRGYIRPKWIVGAEDFEKRLLAVVRIFDDGYGAFLPAYSRTMAINEDMLIYAMLISYVMGNDYVRGLNQRVYEEILIVWPDTLGSAPFAPYTATFMRYARALFNTVTSTRDMYGETWSWYGRKAELRDMVAKDLMSTMVPFPDIKADEEESDKPTSSPRDDIFSFFAAAEGGVAANDSDSSTSESDDVPKDAVGALLHLVEEASAAAASSGNGIPKLDMDWIFSTEPSRRCQQLQLQRQHQQQLPLSPLSLKDWVGNADNVDNVPHEALLSAGTAGCGTCCACAEHDKYDENCEFIASICERLLHDTEEDHAAFQLVQTRAREARQARQKTREEAAKKQAQQLQEAAQQQAAQQQQLPSMTTTAHLPFAFTTPPRHKTHKTFIFSTPPTAQQQKSSTQHTQQKKHKVFVFGHAGRISGSGGGGSPPKQQQLAQKQQQLALHRASGRIGKVVSPARPPKNEAQLYEDEYDAWMYSKQQAEQAQLEQAEQAQQALAGELAQLEQAQLEQARRWDGHEQQMPPGQQDTRQWGRIFRYDGERSISRRA